MFSAGGAIAQGEYAARGGSRGGYDWFPRGGAMGGWSSQAQTQPDRFVQGRVDPYTKFRGGSGAFAQRMGMRSAASMGGGGTPYAAGPSQQQAAIMQRSQEGLKRAAAQRLRSW